MSIRSLAECNMIMISHYHTDLQGSSDRSHSKLLQEHHPLGSREIPCIHAIDVCSGRKIVRVEISLILTRILRLVINDHLDLLAEEVHHTNSNFRALRNGILNGR